MFKSVRGKSPFIKALTLIETLLVIVVIALILMVAMNQAQRFQQNRTMQVAQSALDTLSSYASKLYLKYCVALYAVDPTSASNPMAPTPFSLDCPDSSNNAFCYASENGQLQFLQITNPFLPPRTQTPQNNYAVSLQNPAQNISSTNTVGPALIVIALPLDASALHISGSLTVSNLEKYIGALKPTRIAFKNQPKYTIIGDAGNNTYAATADHCLRISGADACFEWVLTLNNAGTLDNVDVGNAVVNQNLTAFSGQYYPQQRDTYDSWYSPTGKFGRDKEGCLGAMQYYYRQKNKST